MSERDAQEEMSERECPCCGAFVPMVYLGNYGWVLDDHECLRPTAEDFDADELGLDPEEEFDA